MSLTSFAQPLIVSPNNRVLRVQKELHHSNRASLCQVIDINSNCEYVLKIFDKYAHGKLNMHGQNEYFHSRYFQKHQSKISKSESLFSGIVPVIETFESSHNWFILVKYLGDKDLQQRIGIYQCYRHHYPEQFPIEDWYEHSRKIAFSLIQALWQLHINGLYHLDISLENIFVQSDEAFLIDFESMLYSPDPIIKREQLNTVCWKSNYSPREAYNPTPIINVSNIDIYELGITLFALFVTQFPYEKIDDNFYMELMEYGVLARCKSLNHRIDIRLADLLDSMLGTCGRQIISISEVLQHPFFVKAKIYVPEQNSAKELHHLEPFSSTPCDASDPLSRLPSSVSSTPLAFVKYNKKS